MLYALGEDDLFKEGCFLWFSLSDLKVLENHWHYSGTPPYGYLAITANYFCPGETSIDYLTKKKTPAKMANGYTPKSQNVIYNTLYFYPVNTATQTN